MKPVRIIALGLALATLAGCANHNSGLYTWGNYEDSLHDYYSEPTKQAELMAELADAARDAEKTGKKLAPGLYAEYGFLLQQKGQYGDAISNYSREKKQWPESAQLMDTLIANANRLAQGKKTEASGS